MTEGLDRFAFFKREAQEKYGLAADDTRANMLAGLMLCQERNIELMAAGKHVDFAAFTRCLELIEKYIPVVTPKVTVEFVGEDEAPPDSAAVSGHAKCRRCGWSPPGTDRVERCYMCSWKSGDDFSAPGKPLLAELAPPAPNKVSEPSPPQPAPLPTRRNVSTSEFHDQIVTHGDKVVLAPIKDAAAFNNSPLSRDVSAINRRLHPYDYVQGIDSPIWHGEPAPDLSGHQLPDPTRKT